MERKQLIDLLNADRTFHLSHPQEINTKLLYTIGGSFGAITLGVYIKSGKVAMNFENIYLGIGGIATLFVVGFLLIFIGLYEHNKLHSEQRNRIEDAINYILGHKTEKDFQYEIFLEKFKLQHLKCWGKIQLKKATPLFTFEPDTRNYLSYHDRKIDFGIFLIIIAYCLLIWNAIAH